MRKNRAKLIIVTKMIIILVEVWGSIYNLVSVQLMGPEIYKTKGKKR